MHHVEAVFRWRCKIEFGAEPLQKVWRGTLPDAHGAVALHIAVAAHRTGTGARAAHVTTQQQQVHDLLDVRHAILVLCHAHRPAADHRPRRGNDRRDLPDAQLGNAGAGGDGLPRLGAEVFAQKLETVGALAYECAVDTLRVRFDDRLLNALQEGHVSIDAHRQIIRGERCPGAQYPHHFLRMLEALQSRFLEWIDTDNTAAAPRGPLQSGEHARVIRAGILADHDNAICQFEIGEGHGALAGAEGLEHAHATRLVTHVRAIREIVGAELSHEQLIQKGGFVAGATRRVEHRLIGRRQRVQLAPDEIERGIPADREVMGAPFR